ncbi:MAG: hypothetical protein AAB224_07090 [Gemmatimonadota bacterium]
MSIRGVIELLRRVALLAGLMVAVCLAFLTRFEPMVVVSLDTSGKAGERGDSTWARPKGSAAAEVVSVRGPAWNSLFAGVARSFTENLPIAGWEHRIKREALEQARKDNASRGGMSEAQRADEADRVKRLKEQYGQDVSFTGSFHSLYFAAAEAPFRDLPTTWREGTSYVLRRAAGDQTSLEVAYISAYELHGFSDVISAPEAFSYPYRHLAPWVALAALVFYALLPWGRIPSDVVAYARWRVVLSDFVTTGLLAVPFFALPIAIIGGTVETAKQFLPLAAVFWLIASLGAAGVFWAASAAAYRLAVLPDRLTATGLRGAIQVPYAAVRTVHPVRLRPPRWLIAAAWVSALLGRSASAAVGQVGRALLLQSSAANGLRLDLDGGAHHYIWFSDQMGSTAVEHFGRLNEALRREGITWSETTVEMRALTPPSR